MRVSKRIILAVFGALLLLILPASVAAQQPYGRGNYGACAYSEGCSPAPNTVVPVPPSPANPQPGRAISVNLTDDQTISGPNFTVISTPNFSVDQVERVEFLQDGVVVGQTSSPIDGLYEIEWVTPPPGTYTVSVIVYLVDGSTIRRDFTVIVGEGSVRNEAGAESNNSTGSTDDSTGGFFSGFFGGVFTSLKDSINRLVQNTPKALAYAMPYGFLAILGLLAGLLLLQVRNQLRHIAVLLALLKKDEQLADEKTTFIMLVSHYFRTPLTVIRGNLELYTSVPSTATDPKLVVAAQAAVEQLRLKSEALLKDVEDNSYLKGISKPDIAVTKQKLYHSWSLVVPIVLSVMVFVLLNTVFLVAGKTQLVIPNIILQVVIAVVIGVATFTLIQRKQQYNQEQAKISQQTLYQEQLDIARNAFITQVAQEITPILAVAKQKSQQAIPATKRKAVDESFNSLDSLVSRFVLAAELEKGKINTSLSTFKLDQTINAALASQQASASQKGLQVANATKPISLYQSTKLVRYVLDALIDNAVNYATPNSPLQVASGRTSRSKTHVAIKNQGDGIPPEKLERLFKPFSHVGGVETFMDQGVGLNLYLSRLITRYLGGDLELQSNVGKDTTAMVTLPLKGPAARTS